MARSAADRAPKAARAPWRIVAVLAEQVGPEGKLLARRSGSPWRVLVADIVAEPGRVASSVCRRTGRARRPASGSSPAIGAQQAGLARAVRPGERACFARQPARSSGPETRAGRRAATDPMAARLIVWGICSGFAQVAIDTGAEAAGSPPAKSLRVIDSLPQGLLYRALAQALSQDSVTAGASGPCQLSVGHGLARGHRVLG